jgi:hypothetical protein
MGIHSSTRIQAYQLRKGGAPARLAILKMIAVDSVNNSNEHTRLTPGDWKGARNYTLESYASAFRHELDQGLQDGEPVWYSHGGEQFRGERFADECEGGPDHTGWYTDGDCSESSRGIVGRLNHGRFIAGYHWYSNDERVYFPQVFYSERDAARASDSHAERFADYAREYSERFDAMRDAETARDDARHDFLYAWKARHVSEDHRETAREAIETLREAIETLKDATADYENGGK